MSIINGQYSSPDWRNNNTPFVTADAMQEMTDTAALEQTRTGDVKLGISGTDFTVDERASNARFHFENQNEANRLSSSKTFCTRLAINSLESDFADKDAHILTSIDDNNNFFAMQMGTSPTYRSMYARVDEFGTLSDIQYNNLFYSIIQYEYGKPDKICLSINKQGIGIAYAYYESNNNHLLAYTLDGGKSWTDVYYSYVDASGYNTENIYSLCVTNNGRVLIMFESGRCLSYDAYTFFNNNTRYYSSVMHYSYPFGEGATLYDVTEAVINSNGFGIVFNTDSTNTAETRKYAYTTDGGLTWTVKTNFAEWVHTVNINEDNKVGIIGQEYSSWRGFAKFYNLSDSGLAIEGSVGNLDWSYYPYSSILRILANDHFLMYYASTKCATKPPFASVDLLTLDSSGIHTCTSMNNNGLIVAFSSSPLAADPNFNKITVYRCGYPIINYGHICTDVINPFSL